MTLPCAVCCDFAATIRQTIVLWENLMLRNADELFSLRFHLNEIKVFVKVKKDVATAVFQQDNYMGV